MQELEKKLNYTFRNQELLREALNHSSYANEHRSQGLGSNERLEFLGDSVLGFVTAEYLFARHPDLPEGDLTRIRAALVCEQSLHEVAQKLNLGSYLKLGKGEEAGGGRHRPSIQADAVEAVLAAVYLDGGIGSARKIIQKFILSREVAGLTKPRDYKTALQELVQRESGQVLKYRLTGEEGPDHDKRFFVEVDLNGEVVGRGKGHSKADSRQGRNCQVKGIRRRAAPSVPGLFCERKRAAPEGASKQNSRLCPGIFLPEGGSAPPEDWKETGSPESGAFWGGRADSCQGRNRQVKGIRRGAVPSVPGLFCALLENRGYRDERTSGCAGGSFLKWN